MSEIKIETIKLKSIKLDTRNARQHSDRNLTVIQESLQSFGQRKPVVVTDENVVIAGNGTVQAARTLGWDSIVVTRIPADWTPEQIKAYAIADNRAGELANWDPNELFKTLAELDQTDLLNSTGFESDDLDDLRALVEEISPTPSADPTAQTDTDPTQGGMFEGGTRYTPTLTEYAERYANKATRVLMADFPNITYIWLMEKLAQLRSELSINSNADAILELVAQYAGERPPTE